jgi:hypothetical protein
MSVYEVQLGDTPAAIAKKVVGDVDRTKDLILANPQKKWFSYGGNTTFKSLTVGEKLYIPESWLGFIGDVSASNSTEVFPIDKLSAAAKQQLTDLQSVSKEASRFNAATSAISSVAAGGSVSWDMVVATAATIATLAGSPALGAAVAAVGYAAEAFYNVLDDVIGILGGSTPIKSAPTDISMDCVVGKDLLSGRPRVDRVVPYGFNDNAWWHVIDRNVLVPGTEQWDPRVRLPGLETLRLSGRDILGSYPNFGIYQFFGTPSIAMFWMFGVVFNELWAMDDYLYKNPNIDPAARTEIEFRKYFYGLLLRNWESRVNCNVNMNDRTLLIGAINLWNDAHSDSSKFVYNPMYPEPSAEYLVNAAQGYCSYAYTISGASPIGEGDLDQCGHPWSITNLRWTTTTKFVEFMLTSTFDYQGRFAPISINTGPKIQSKLRLTIQSGKKFQRLPLDSRISTASPGEFTQLDIGTVDEPSHFIRNTAIVSTVAIATAIGYYAYSSGMTYTGAAKNIYYRSTGWIKRKSVRLFARENPEVEQLPESTPPAEILNLPKKKSKKRKVAYRVDLSQDPSSETVRMLPNGDAAFYRKNVEIAKFKPTLYQLTKIRAGSGALLIHTDQLL